METGTAAPAPTVEDPDRDKGEEDDGEEMAAAPQRTRTGLRIACFNLQRMRRERLGMHDQYLAFVATMASFDVLIVQELPHAIHPDELDWDNAAEDAKQMDAQLDMLCETLKLHSAPGSEWYYARLSPAAAAAALHEALPDVAADGTSPESPAQGDAGYPVSRDERHAVFVKAPDLRIQTHTCYSHAAGGEPFACPQLRVTVDVVDATLIDLMQSRTLSITSVHLAAHNAARRDAELRGMLGDFKFCVLERHMQALSMQANPITPEPLFGGKIVAPPEPVEMPTTALFVGDFNAALDDGALRKLDMAPALLKPQNGAHDSVVVDAPSMHRMREHGVEVVAERLMLDFLARPDEAVLAAMPEADAGDDADAEREKVRAAVERAASYYPIGVVVRKAAASAPATPPGVLV